MCKCASGILIKGHIALWSRKSDRHSEIIAEHNLHTDGVRGPNIVPFEISPPGGNLSLPLKDWVYRLDSEVERNLLPDWYDEVEAEKAARHMLVEWAKVKLTGWNVQEAFNPINPLLIKAKPMSRDEMEKLVRQWDSVMSSAWSSAWSSVGASVWDSVWASVWSSVGASVMSSVWASVRASVRAGVGGYIGGLFPDITEWKYAKALGSDPWRPLLTLWYAGYVPSFDGKKWRLHAGKDAKIVFETEVKS